MLAPDVNKSEAKFTVEKNKIIFGTSAIKNLGDGMAVKIVEERKKAGMAGSEQNSKAVRTKSEQGKLSNEDKIQQNLFR